MAKLIVQGVQAGVSTRKHVTESNTPGLLSFTFVPEPSLFSFDDKPVSTADEATQEQEQASSFSIADRRLHLYEVPLQRPVQ